MQMTIDIVPPEFRKYAGPRPWLGDPLRRAEHMSFNLVTELLADAETPFGRMARNGLLLSTETAEYLNGSFGFIENTYQTGSKPVLENYIDSVVSDGMDDAEKVIALSQSLDDLRKRHPSPPSFLYGESDEETILKGGGHCSCRARVLAAMAQVIGLQARPAMMWAWVDPKKPDELLGGHTVAEIHLDGQWGFFDPQHHLYARTHDGSFPGMAMIRDNPEIFYDIPEDEAARMQPTGYPHATEGRALFEYYWYKNFDPRCPISISRHDVNEPYVGQWSWATPEFREKQDHDYNQFKSVLFKLAEEGKLTEEVYRMDVDEFREFAGITDGQLASWKNRKSA